LTGVWTALLTGLGSVMKHFQLREVDLERNLIVLLDELDKAAEVLQLVH
jgi:hypothetical protein